MNKDYGITVENLLNTLPDILKNDKSLFALATVAAELLAEGPDEIDALRIYTRIDELPEYLLDILAYDFKVDWWDPEYTLDEKRQTLKDSWHVHRKLGTKGAVIKAISAIYKNTEISEWFEYGGDPFYFKLLIDVTYDNVDPAKHQRVLERVRFYKNLRSHLDGLEYVANPQGHCTTYAAVAAAGIYTSITVEVAVYGMG